MVESRCGLVCSECEYAVKTGCKGCFAGDPFWGVCKVAACCVGKGHEHCGVCGQFPCESLRSFSYDEEQGDNGARIEVLKSWAGKN